MSQALNSAGPKPMGLLRDPGPPPPYWPPPADAGTAAEARQWARQRDPIGDQVHLALVMLYVLLIPVSKVFSGIALAAAVGYALLRLHATWRVYPVLLRDAVGWLLLAWFVWHALSLLWSSDPVQGASELWAFRVLITSFVVWPVIDRMVWIIAAFLIGVAITNGVQVAQWVELNFFDDGGRQRLGGLLHPVTAGTVCLVAVCWHTVALFRTRGVAWWLTVAGVALATFGLIFSGSRGPWIAAAVTLPLLLGFMFLRSKTSVRFRLTAAAAVVLVLAVTLFVGFDHVRHRINLAMEQWQTVVEEQDYSGSIGMRYAWYRWAWEIHLQAPLIGKGLGSYLVEAEKLDSFDPRVERKYPHSVPLHTLAVTGWIGLVIGLAIAVAAIIRTAREPQSHVYAFAGLFVLIGLLVGGLFESHQFVGRIFGLFVLVTVMTWALAHHPTANGLRSNSRGSGFGT